MSKESHSFNPDVAKVLGVNAALIFQHLVFLHKSSLDKKDSWDGRYWIKKTARAFEATYSYLSQKEIRGALDRLEKDGYILAMAGLSENKFDRAKSFSIEEKGFDLMEIPPEERQVFTCDKRANGGHSKGKSDVDKRANQMLTKGQMNNSYNSYSSSNDIDNTPEEKPQPPQPEKAKTLDEALSTIKAWLNAGGIETVKVWYELQPKRYNRKEFEAEMENFCSNYLNTSEEGRSQKFKRDPLAFFQNGFRVWLRRSDGFKRESTKPTPSQNGAVYTPPSKRF